ncbi:unnamed protein product [Caenorhabditis angaria]|uniref:Uncharacterized protein n=1 Tax=Caenorhabditis angaria TaxID=860376 RepID=A0A9P1J2I5_9PELO|nr:unnamed protein product [Caenorhabditis angaria]
MANDYDLTSEEVFVSLEQLTREKIVGSASSKVLEKSECENKKFPIQEKKSAAELENINSLSDNDYVIERPTRLNFDSSDTAILIPESEIPKKTSCCGRFFKKHFCKFSNVLINFWMLATFCFLVCVIYKVNGRNQ